MSRKYGFNFLGHHSEADQREFDSWVNSRADNFPAIQRFYQIRAAQLRKTSGVLEKYYKEVHEEELAPTFQKEVWQPGPDGWFPYTYRDDHLPMLAMSKIKAHVREQLQRQDEAVFQMNHLRNLIEKMEDKAQRANEAKTDIQSLFAEIKSYFQKPEYQAVLVKDADADKFRTNQLQPPTGYEQTQKSSGTK